MRKKKQLLELSKMLPTLNSEQMDALVEHARVAKSVQELKKDKSLDGKVLDREMSYLITQLSDDNVKKLIEVANYAKKAEAMNELL